jgi:hypothetical protein
MRASIFTALCWLLLTGCPPGGPEGPPGPAGAKGDKGDKGEKGEAGGGSSGPSDSNMIRWESAAQPWSQLTGSATPVANNTTDVRDGEVAYDFTVPAGGSGASYFYGEMIAVDPSLPYRGRISAKLLAGAGTFFAGVQAYDAAKQPLKSNEKEPAEFSFFIARNEKLPNGAWTEFVGVIAGVGKALDQFPEGTRFIRPVVVVNANDVGTTRVDAFRISPDDSIRTIARWQGYAGEGDDNNVPFTTRRLTLRKLGHSTGVRVVWSDNFRVLGNNSACRWEVLFNGAPCANPGPAYFDKYEGNTTSNRHDPSSFVGTCFGLPAGPVAITTRSTFHTGRTANGDCYTGWSDQLASIEAEEVR